MKCSLLTLSSYLDGELDASKRGELQAHLVGCQRCRDGLAHVQEEVDRVAALARVQVPDHSVRDLMVQLGLLGEDEPLPERSSARPAAKTPADTPPWLSGEVGKALPWSVPRESVRRSEESHPVLFAPSDSRSRSSMLPRDLGAAREQRRREREEAESQRAAAFEATEPHSLWEPGGPSAEEPDVPGREVMPETTSVSPANVFENGKGEHAGEDRDAPAESAPVPPFAGASPELPFDRTANPPSAAARNTPPTPPAPPLTAAAETPLAAASSSPPSEGAVTPFAGARAQPVPAAYAAGSVPPLAPPPPPPPPLSTGTLPADIPQTVTWGEFFLRIRERLSGILPRGRRGESEMDGELFPAAPGSSPPPRTTQQIPSRSPLADMSGGAGNMSRHRVELDPSPSFAPRTRNSLAPPLAGTGSAFARARSALLAAGARQATTLAVAGVAVLLVIGLAVGRATSPTTPLTASQNNESKPSAPQQQQPPPAPAQTQPSAAPPATTPVQLNNIRTLGDGATGLEIHAIRYGAHPSDFRIVFDVRGGGSGATPRTVVGFKDPTTLWVVFNSATPGASVTTPTDSVVTAARLVQPAPSGQTIYEFKLSRAATVDSI
ncbi:MAG TPA: zf-HC2 domain-containing protein [Candidatus Sulfotelmatobacter sp.]|nr:zf-HC2 domain-containing protein [Candidatus Sulfotelmatobacter sp.]